VWVRRLTRALLLLALCGLLPARAPGQERPVPPDAAALIDGLRAKSVEARRSAAVALRSSARGTQRQALPALVDLLNKEKDGQVRLAVLDAVTALGPDAGSAVPALVHTLRSDYGGQREEEMHQDYRSALALAAVGAPAVEGLRGLLKDGKPNVRAEAAMALGRIGADAAPAVPDLIHLLGDKNERIGQEASLALGRIGKTAIVALVAASENRDDLIRARAVASLGHLPVADERAQQAAEKCAFDSAPVVRAAALKTLARCTLADDAFLAILKQNMRHDDERVRLAVVGVLVERRGLLMPMAPDLGSLLTTKNDGVARHAAFLLSKIGPEAAPRLLHALGDENGRVDQIGEALAHIGRPVAPLLAEALGSSDPRVRQAAALAIGQIRPVMPETVKKLADSLHDSDVKVRAASLAAIGGLGPRAAEAIASVRGMLHDESAEVRTEAVAILAQRAPHDDGLTHDLVALLDDPDARVQRQVIDTLRSLGPVGRDTASVVTGKLRSTDPDVRRAAVEFVGSQPQFAALAVPALSSLLGDASPKIRAIAAQALGKLGKAAQPALAPLTALLTAEQVEVREAAATALGGLELDAAIVRAPLVRALRDDKTEVRRAATRAIQRLGPQAAIFVPDIILLAEKTDNVRSVERMLRRFERAGPDARSVPELIKLLEHKKEGVRLLAIKFLALAGQKAQDALPTLEQMSGDPSTEVRKQAAAAHDRIKKGISPIESGGKRG
jgi:HEAT repeat protein